jgi:ribA/ribD-fused uncharacterized protein
MIDSFCGQYAFLSNFYPCEVEFDGVTYSSSEHAYQAAKTIDLNEREAIRNLQTPGQAKRAGQKVKMRPDWRNWKTYFMRQILESKFSNPEMREKLLSTGDEELVEGNNWNDTYWGVCDGKGKNNLGRILMSIRDDLKNNVSGTDHEK